MMHLIKLAVGIRDVAHLGEVQAQRAVIQPPLRHRTRHKPKRAVEILAGGSIYWVINKIVLARQRVTDIINDAWDDGSPCCGLILDPDIVRVAALAKKPFQGWRYLEPREAPPDLGGDAAAGDELPERMRRELASLALL